MTPNLSQIIYVSTANGVFTDGALAELLRLARDNNARAGLTGMLLYADGFFFQVLEGETGAVETRFNKIASDRRHRQVTMIINEPIARRSFDSWTMGLQRATPGELADLVGINDFLDAERAVVSIDAGRARKLLAAFRDGRWSDKPSTGHALPRVPDASPRPMPAVVPAPAAPLSASSGLGPAFSYAFQPIVDAVARKNFSFEALIRGPGNEPAIRVLERVPPESRYEFDAANRAAAIALACRLGLDCHINLNFLPQGLYASESFITSTLDAAVRHGLPLDALVLEVTEGEVIADYALLGRRLNEYRAMGVKVAIDDFGAGYSGLNMLADFQPDQIKIDMNLVRGIEKHGPRQSIVRAIVQVCGDLGIDVIAEGVESMAEYEWFVAHGTRLFQGHLFALPGFECLPQARFPWIV